MSGTIEQTLFFINYRKHANEFLQLREGPNADKIIVLANNIKTIHKEIKKAITKINKKVRQHVNIIRKDSP